MKAATVLMASLCALRLIKECGNYDRGEGNNKVTLRLHCAISCGALHCMCLGEDDRWEFLVSGEPLSKIGKAIGVAGIGEVCLCEDAHEYIQDQLEVRVSNGSFLLTGRKAPPTFNKDQKGREKGTLGFKAVERERDRASGLRGEGLENENSYRSNHSGQNDGFADTPGVPLGSGSPHSPVQAKHLRRAPLSGKFRTLHSSSSGDRFKLDSDREEPQVEHPPPPPQVRKDDTVQTVSRNGNALSNAFSTFMRVLSLPSNGGTLAADSSAAELQGHAKRSYAEASGTHDSTIVGNAVATSTLSPVGRVLNYGYRLLDNAHDPFVLLERNM